MRSAIFVALVACSCGPSDNTAVKTVFDPCSPVVLTSTKELASIEAAAKLWNDLAGTAYSTVDAKGPHIPVKFQAAADNFHGLYDDNAGIIYINSDIVDDNERAIVIAHEIGHSLGLLHRSDVASVMNPDNTKTKPDEEDKASLVRLWGSCR
jgi:hypothetical protein